MKLQQLHEAQYAYRAEPFVFANNQKFVPDALISPDTDQAEQILGRIQLPKVNKLAEILGIEWNAMHVKRFAQDQGYGYRQGSRQRMVWSYILVGTDEDGNEIAYYKYEGGTGGSGQSYVYSNKRNKTKLSILLKSTTEEAKRMLQGGKKKFKRPAKQIAKRRVIEAQLANQSQEMFFLIEETGNTDLPLIIVGPFATKDQARVFEKQIDKNFGDVTVFGPTDVYGVTSPNKYVEEVRKQHKYWSDSEN